MTNGHGEPFILFELNNATYAVRSRDIQQLEMVGSITPVPTAPEFVEGVVSVRGEVIPAVNLRARFGFERAQTGLRTRLLVVRVGKRAVALLVDSAREFAAIDPKTIQPPPPTVAEISGHYLEGVAHINERLILILNVAALLETGAIDGAETAHISQAG